MRWVEVTKYDLYTTFIVHMKGYNLPVIWVSLLPVIRKLIFQDIGQVPATHKQLSAHCLNQGLHILVSHQSNAVSSTLLQDNTV